MSKRISFIIIAAIYCLGVTKAQTPQLLNNWPYVTMPAPATTPNFAMANEIFMSAIYFNAYNGEVAKFHFDRSYFEGWPVQLDSIRFYNGPIVVDIDHDGQSEIVCIGSYVTNGYSHSYLYCIDNNGAIMSEFPIILYRPISLNVFDLNGDGEYEILTYSVDEMLIHCFSRYGIEISNWPQVLPYDVVGNTIMGSGAAVGDIDNDGAYDYFIQGLKHIYCLRYDGSSPPGFPISIQDTSYSFSNGWVWPLTLGDVDWDGYLELLIGADNLENGNPDFGCFVAIYEQSGQIKEGWPIHFDDAILNCAPIPADIDSDGIIEIGFQISRYMYFVDIEGMPKPGWPTLLYSPDGSLRGSTSDIILVDINADGASEIFTDYNVFYPDSVWQDSAWNDGYSYFFALNNLGQQLPGYPIIVNGSYLGRPPNFGYLFQESRLYMGLFTETISQPGGIDTGYMEIYIFPDSTGPPNQWPMLSHDNLMTRNYNFVDNATNIHDGRQFVPNSYMLKQNYPNPFNSSTTISFDIPREEHVNLSIYNILGQKELEILDEKLRPGRYTRQIDLCGQASGMYFTVLLTERTIISRKMMMVK